MAGRYKWTNPTYLVGRKFGKLLVLNFDSWYIKNERHRVSKWLCKCDCGNTKAIHGTSLTGGLTNTYGCGIKERALLRVKKTILTNPDATCKDLYRVYKRGAKIRNYTFNLNLEEFKKLTSLNCHYCNKPPSQIRKSVYKCIEGNHYIYNGIDRIDNSIGYELENCITCCGICNKMKMTKTYNEFLDYIKNIYSNLNLGLEESKNIINKLINDTIKKG